MRKLVLSVLLLTLLTPLLYGQAFTSLSGVVTDPSGAVVPGATITIVNTHENLLLEKKIFGGLTASLQKLIFKT